MPGLERSVVGWDVGGAHLKACLLQRGQVVDVAQWACPLWQGLQHLEQALGRAAERWPALATAQHAVTMTGEMTDLFADREDGVARIAERLAHTLPQAPQFYAGDAGWCNAAQVPARWAQIASANWLAAAQHVASSLGRDGVFIDIGSTTTDLIVFKAGRVPTASRSDAQRLASGELVYHGVVRTPLCAVAPRIAFRGAELNVMNEFFATTADVYRLTQELNPAHDLHPSADNAPKDASATRRRLARMVGLDAREASEDDWLAFAQAWRAHQVNEISRQLHRQLQHGLAAHGVAAGAAVVSAGCGDFLVADVLARARAGTRPGSAAGASRVLRYGSDIARIAPGAATGADGVAAWAQVCAPSVAVAALFDREHA